MNPNPVINELKKEFKFLFLITCIISFYFMFTNLFNIKYCLYYFINYQANFYI